MSTTFLSQVYEALKAKNLKVAYQEKDIVDIEYMTHWFKRYEGPDIKQVDYCVTFAMAGNKLGFIISCALYPLSEIHQRYSLENGKKLMTVAKNTLAADVPYLTEDTSIPIAWEIEERANKYDQKYLALEGTGVLGIDDVSVEEFLEFMDGWQDFPIFEFEEVKFD
jgi:hypothetical protein